MGPRGILNEQQVAEAQRMIEAIAAADPPPVITHQERQMLRRLWRYGAKLVSEFEDLKRIYGRIKRKDVQ